MLVMNSPLLMSYEIYAAPCITIGDAEDQIAYRFGFQFYEWTLSIWLRNDD